MQMGLGLGAGSWTWTSLLHLKVPGCNLLHSHVAPIVVAAVMAMLDLCRRNSRPTWMSTGGELAPGLPQSRILLPVLQSQSRFYGSTDDLLRNATAPTALRCASVNCKSGLKSLEPRPKTKATRSSSTYCTLTFLMGVYPYMD